MPGMQKTMHEFKAGKLHSGSKTGPKVTSRKQAIAIGMHNKGERKESAKAESREPASLRALEKEA